MPIDANAGQDRLLKHFFDLPFVGMAILSPVTGRWLQVNDRLCEILGYEREELLESSWQQFTLPEDLSTDQAQFDRLAACEVDGYTQGKRYLRKGGGLIDVAVNVKCVSCADGEAEYLIMTVRDITERKAAEQALQARLELQDQLAKMAATVPGVICSFRLRPNGGFAIPYASPAMADLYGFRPEQVAEDSNLVMGRIHADDVGHVWETIAESARAMTPWRDTFRYLHPSKGEVWIESHSMPLREADGATLWHGYTQDITERKQGEERLRRQLHLNQAMTDCAAESIFLTDADDRITFVNPEAERVFGYTSHEFLGQGLHDLLHHHHPDGRPYPFEDCPNCRIYASGEGIRHHEVVFFRKDGSPVTMTCSNAPLEIDGELTGAVLIAHDISAHKRAEQALREADQHKDEFLAMLAHELRNPLAPIRNAAYVLGRLELADPRVRWAQALIENQVTHLTRLVDDLLDVSRIAWGKIELKREPVEFATLVQQALETCGPLIEAKGHQLTLSLPDPPLVLFGDPVRLTQVLINLLDNAAQYTPDHGFIELRARREGQEIEMAIRDNGSGIPAALQPCLFDLFQQGERSLERAQGGLGIGLTLVKNLVELHGGQVEVFSAGPGKGTIFTVRLPIQVESLALPRGQPCQAERSRRAGRVLVVDDDPAVVESTAVFLALEGYEVRTADSGAAALKQMAEFQPRAVLLDIGLPGQDGYEVARRLRQLPGGADLQLVAVSGYGHDEAVSRCREAGFDHHLVKPVDPAELSALLAE